jgi:hypothetical protein
MYPARSACRFPHTECAVYILPPLAKEKPFVTFVPFVLEIWP